MDINGFIFFKNKLHLYIAYKFCQYSEAYQLLSLSLLVSLFIPNIGMQWIA